MRPQHQQHIPPVPIEFVHDSRQENLDRQYQFSRKLVYVFVSGWGGVSKIAGLQQVVLHGQHHGALIWHRVHQVGSVECT